MALGLGAVAQDVTPDDPNQTGDNGFILTFIEERLSAPGRRIAVNGVSGALSSVARIAEVTVSDDDGVWLTLSDVEIDWSRAALLLGRVNVSQLSAARIQYLRPPRPPEQTLFERLPEPEATPFSLPELPVSVTIEALTLPQIEISEPVIGQAAQFSATGRLRLAGGELDTAVEVLRTDQPGGSLDLAASFSNATRELGIDLTLEEAQGGVVSTLLGIEDRPAISLAVEGAGPLDDLDVSVAFDAAGTRIVSGDVSLRGAEEGLGFTADFSGTLSPLVPEPYRAFFEGETSVEVVGVSRSGGGLTVERLAVQGAVLDLTGSLETADDGFPRRLALSGQLGDPRGPALTLPVPGGETQIQAGTVYVRYGDGRRWSGFLVLDRLVAGGVEIEDLTLEMGGIAENLNDPAARNVTIALEGVATGVWSEDPDIARTLGTRLDLFADLALPPSEPFEIRQAQVSGNGLALSASGGLDGLAYDGQVAVRVADIAPASGLAGRDLAGSLDLEAEGTLDALAGSFDLTLDGTAEGLRLGDPRLDGLLEGTTTLAGTVARDEAGIRTDGFRLANPQIEITSEGRLSSRETDLAVNILLEDLGVFDPRLAGSLRVTGEATGEGRPVRVRLDAEAEDASVMGRSLTDARLGLTGSLDGTDIAGALRGGADFDGAPIALSADLALDQAARRLENLVARIGPNSLTGDVVQAAGGTFDGTLTLRAPDVAPLAALALTEARGSVDAEIVLTPGEAGQAVALSAEVRDLVVSGTEVARLDLEATVANALAAPMVQGTLNGQGIRAGGIDITRLDLDVDQTGPETTRVDAGARLAIGTELDLEGEVTRLPEGLSATVETLSLRQQDVAAVLTEPATFTVAGGTVELTPLALDFGSGALTAEGSVGETFDVTLGLRTLPLGIGNLIQPELALEGALDGSARITGPRASPDVRFDLTGTDIASAQTRAAGLPPVRLTAEGSSDEGRLTLDADLAAEGLEARATGSVPLGAGPLAVDVTLATFPLQIVDRIAGGRGLAGAVTGGARIGGTVAQPEVAFDLRGVDVSAAVLRDSGIAALGISARGGFAGNTLTLGALEVSNAQGLEVTASGSAPLGGQGLDLRASGTVPLSLANALLEERTAEASGLARFDATVSGSVGAPQVSGSAAIENGAIFDPTTNVRLRDVTADARFDGDAIVLNAFRAEVPSGGNITAGGRVSLDTGLPADLAIQFNDVRYTDGVFVTTRLDGELAVVGPLVGEGGVVSGLIDLGTTEISVAEGLGGNAQGMLDVVVHRLPPPRVQATLERANVGEPDPPRPAPRGGLQTDVLIRAPNQIFVRGRGLDVELGGELRVTGPITDIVPVGQFELRRGRLEILSQRIEFDEGSLQLTGNLNPELFFVARTTSDDVTAIITVSGRASEPEITFSSTPTLPEDEVLARIIFNRSVGNLSAFQIAQLAGAAAELAGAGGQTGILGALRGAIGVDDLDVITEEDGETAVRAGRYIDDNIYLDVQAEADGDTRARINLDVNDNVTLRGSVGSDGNSSLGVFYERDY